MYKLTVKYTIDGKKPYTGHFNRTALSKTIDQIMFAFPNNEIKEIRILPAVVDVFDDKAD